MSLFLDGHSTGHPGTLQKGLGSVWQSRSDWGLCEGGQSEDAVAANSEKVNRGVQEGLKIEEVTFEER